MRNNSIFCKTKEGVNGNCASLAKLKKPTSYVLHHYHCLVSTAVPCATTNADTIYHGYDSIYRNNNAKGENDKRNFKMPNCAHTQCRFAECFDNGSFTASWCIQSTVLALLCGYVTSSIQTKLEFVIWFYHDCECHIVVEIPCFDKNLPASTGNLPLEILAVEHTPYTKYFGAKWIEGELFNKFCMEVSYKIK